MQSLKIMQIVVSVCVCDDISFTGLLVFSGV